MAVTIPVLPQQQQSDTFQKHTIPHTHTHTHTHTHQQINTLIPTEIVVQSNIHNEEMDKFHYTVQYSDKLSVM